MSLLQRCDICGRVEGKIKFDPRPIKIQIPNFGKKKINVYANVWIEDPKDVDKIIKFNQQVAMINMMNEMNETSSFESEEFMEVEDLEKLEQDCLKSLSIPEPRICKKCKREMAKLISSYGSFDKAVDIVGENFEMPKKDK